MFRPTLGRWLQQDPIGFDAGDENLYRSLENDPIGEIDPLGLQVKEQGPQPRLIELGPEPRMIEEGVGAPPVARDQRPPSVTIGGIVYSNTFSAGEPIRLTRTKEDKLIFTNQRRTAPQGSIVETAEVKVYGWRRFPNDKSNDSGDHIAWVIVQIRFLKGKCVDKKK